jgi:hypothetical protein
MVDLPQSGMGTARRPNGQTLGMPREMYHQPKYYSKRQSLRQDLDDYRALYGRTLENREIIEKTLPVPKEAKPLIALLNKYSPHSASANFR